MTFCDPLVWYTEWGGNINIQVFVELFGIVISVNALGIKYSCQTVLDYFNVLDFEKD